MSVREGLIVTLPDGDQTQPLWMRVVDGAVIQQGAGTNWRDACGLSALPEKCVVMLVAPMALAALHWTGHSGMPPRQARVAARLAALDASIGPAESLLAVADENDDPTVAPVVAVVARADMQHWLLWAQHEGLDPDLVVPAALLMPEPASGFVKGVIGGTTMLRGVDMALPAEDPLVEAVVGDAPVDLLAPDALNRAAIAALENPPLNLRQGDFAKRARYVPDQRQLLRLAVWCGFILLASLLISLIAIIKYNGSASRLDAESLALARSVLPDAEDPERIEADMDARLAARGVGAYTFTGPVSGLFTAMQGAPTVALTRLARADDGMLTATLASAKADDINVVLLALQAAGFTVTATSSTESSGRVLADVTVRP